MRRVPSAQRTRGTPIVEIWQRVLDVLNAPITEIGEHTLTPMSAIQIVVILLVTILVTGRIRAFIRRILVQRAGVDERAAALVARVAGFFMIFIGVYIALTSAGFDLNALVAILGGLSVGIAFGTQDIARNVISGVIVSAERRIRIGAEIEIRGFRGFVEEIGPRSVRLRLEDGRRVILASVDFMSQPVILHGQTEPVTEPAEEGA